MLDQLLQLVKENAQDLIVNNNAVPNQFNDAAIGEASNAIHDQLSQAVSRGNLQDVLGMFGNAQNLANNPLVGNIVSQLAGSLGSKFGVDGAQAQNIAAQLIPQILGGLVNKTNNPNDASININDIMGHLSGSGNKGIDFGSIVNQMQQGGKVDLGSLAGQFLGGNKGGGGLGDLLGGFLK
jgi:hypothetical protein